MNGGRGLVVGVALAAACGGITVPDGPAHEGVIVERDRPVAISQDQPTIWVKEDPDEECGVIYVIVPGTSLFARTPAGVPRAATVDELVVGASVRVWTDMVLHSCPGQATAEAVEILLGSG